MPTEILTKKGANLIRLGQGPVAIDVLGRAIELRPDYWPPYAELSDYYKGIGDLRNARAYLEKALSHSPNAEGLKRRLAEFDAVRGKRASIERTPDFAQGFAARRVAFSETGGRN